MYPKINVLSKIVKNIKIFPTKFLIFAFEKRKSIYCVMLNVNVTKSSFSAPPMISMSTEKQTLATQVSDKVSSTLQTIRSVVNATQPLTSTGTTLFQSTKTIPTQTEAPRNSSETLTTTTDVYNSTDSVLNGEYSFVLFSIHSTRFRKQYVAF